MPHIGLTMNSNQLAYRRANLIEWEISVAVMRLPRVVRSNLSLVGSGRHIISAATPVCNPAQRQINK